MAAVPGHRTTVDWGTGGGQTGNGRLQGGERRRRYPGIVRLKTGVRGGGEGSDGERASPGGGAEAAVPGHRTTEDWGTGGEGSDGERASSGGGAEAAVPGHRTTVDWGTGGGGSDGERASPGGGVVAAVPGHRTTVDWGTGGGGVRRGTGVSRGVERWRRYPGIVRLKTGVPGGGGSDGERASPGGWSGGGGTRASYDCRLQTGQDSQSQ